MSMNPNSGTRSAAAVGARPAAPSSANSRPDSPSGAVGRSEATVEAALNAERLFQALDGRWLSVSGEYWRAEVYGILQEGGWRWVQVGLHGAREHMLTLRMVPASGIGQLVLALTAWLATGAELRPHTLTVG